MIKIDNYKLQSELVVDENNKNDKENDMFIFIEDENEILEHIKIEDNFLKNIDVENGTAYDFENNLLVSGQDQPFNEKSYYEMLNKNNSIDNFDDFVVSEQDQPFNQESYFNDFLVSEQESSFNEISYLNSIESTLYELNSDVSLSGLEDDAILENFESKLDNSLEKEIENKDLLTDKIDDEIIANDIFSQPEFEEYKVISENDIIEQDINKETFVNFNNDELDINDLPTINVDDKVSSLYNFDFNDLDELNKVDSNTFTIETSEIDILDNIQEFDLVNEINSNILSSEEIITECIPPSEIHDYTIIEDEPTKLFYEEQKVNNFDMNFNNSLKEEKDIDLSSLLDKKQELVSNEFDNIPLVKTSDSIAGINYEVDLNREEPYSPFNNDIPLIKKNDYVNTIDYSNYSVYGYTQPETLVVDNFENKDKNNNETSSIEFENKRYENQSKYNHSINQSFIGIESKEVICKSRELPTVEEQMKKIKRPNLFRKYSVASAANLVILKSIDRLLNITESAIKRNNKDWNDK